MVCKTPSHNSFRKEEDSIRPDVNNFLNNIFLIIK